jgi:hypothetical protein
VEDETMNMIMALALLAAAGQANDNAVGGPVGSGPGPINNLTLDIPDPLDSTTIHIYFNSPILDDALLLVAAASYQLYALPNPPASMIQTIQANGYVDLATQQGKIECPSEPTPSAPGLRDDIFWTDPAFYIGNPSRVVAVQVKTFGALGESGAFNPLQLVTMPLDATPPGSLQSLLLPPGATPGSVHLQWTSTGDDTNAGHAFRYEVRRSAAPINSNAAFAAGTLVSEPAPAPAAPGVPDGMTVYNFTPDTPHYFGVCAFDEAGNPGPVVDGVIMLTAPAAPVGTAPVKKRGACSAGAPSASLLLPLLIAAALLRSRTLQS